MNILIAAHHYAVASGRYLRDALIRAGENVWTVGPEHGNSIWGISVSAGYEWRNTPPMNTEIDLLIVMDSDPAILEQYQTYPAKRRVVYGVDNHVREYIGNYDHFFLAHAHGPRQPVPSNDPLYSWLPCAYDPTVFKPSAIPWEQRQFDVTLIGFPYPERVRLMRLIRDAGYKIHFSMGSLYHECAAIYQDTRISLCVSAAGDVAQRVFETAACGCLVLSDPLHDLLDATTNRELALAGFALFYSDEELLIQLDALLSDEMQSAQNGAVSMQRIVQRKHTWDERAKTLLKWLTAKPEDN